MSWLRTWRSNAPEHFRGGPGSPQTAGIVSLLPEDVTVGHWHAVNGVRYTLSMNIIDQLCLYIANLKQWFYTLNSKLVLEDPRINIAFFFTKKNQFASFSMHYGGVYYHVPVSSYCIRTISKLFICLTVCVEVFNKILIHYWKPELFCRFSIFLVSF